MPSENGNGQVEKLKEMFEKKYKEEIPLATIVDLTNRHGADRVQEVIEKMKDDAYNPASFLRRSLAQEWYRGNGNGKKVFTEGNGKGNGKTEVEKTTRWIWNIREEAKWISKEEKEYILDVLLHGTPPDGKKVQEIWFRVYQGQYPNRPEVWYYWLPRKEAREAANQWIMDSGRSDIPLYEII